jgi:hypothetical protein
LFVVERLWGHRLGFVVVVQVQLNDLGRFPLPIVLLVGGDLFEVAAAVILVVLVFSGNVLSSHSAKYLFPVRSVIHVLRLMGRAISRPVIFQEFFYTLVVLIQLEVVVILLCDLLIRLGVPSSSGENYSFVVVSFALIFFTLHNFIFL